MTSGDTKSAIFTFIGQEARGLRLVFWRLFWKVTIAIALLVVVCLVVSQGPSGRSNDASLFTQIVAYVAVGVYFGSILGVVAGLFAALWRLFGPALLVVLVAAPVLMVVVIWLFHSAISSSAINFLENVVASARHEGLHQTVQAAEGMRLSCGGGAIGVLFLVLLSPFLLADIGLILANADVLWAFLKFAGTMALTLMTATSVAFFFACPILLFTLIRRGRTRFGQMPLPSP